MDRKEKSDLISSLHEKFVKTTAAVVVHNNGLTVAEITDFRRKICSVGASLKITKNRLTRLALIDTEFEALANMLTGSTAIIYSKDPISVAKISVVFAKDNDKFVIVGGALGKNVLSADDIQSLAMLPPLDELRSKLLGIIQVPAAHIVNILQVLGEQIVRILFVKIEKSKAI
ncbi:MAG: 50S ribosomal protein L10 [Rhodospirillaceae bacterium]|nr:50S ribosomal protein L10 [Rhodospirillaceae bacterium]